MSKKVIPKKLDDKSVKVIVSFNLPFCLDLKDDDYEVQMPSYKAMVKTKRVKQKYFDPRLPIEETSNMDLLHDRYGRIFYTNVEVTIPKKVVVELHSQADGSVSLHIGKEDLVDNFSQWALNKSIEVINYLIAVYREETDSFYLRTVSKDDVLRARIEWFYQNQLLGWCEHGGFGKAGIGIKTPRPSHFEQGFKERLKVYEQTSLLKELLMNARDYLDLNNYRMAVIEARTCIEVLVDQLLLGYFKHQGTTIENAKTLLEVSKNKQCTTLEDVLERAKINAKLANGLKQALGRSLKDDGKLWGRWLKAKKNREKAVHRAIEIDETEAKEAINVLTDIRDFVSI